MRHRHTTGRHKNKGKRQSYALFMYFSYLLMKRKIKNKRIFTAFDTKKKQKIFLDIYFKKNTLDDGTISFDQVKICIQVSFKLVFAQFCIYLYIINFMHFLT